MTKVKIIKPYIDKYTGEYISSACNPVIEVEDERAQELVDAGVAKIVKEPVSEPEAQSEETKDTDSTDEKTSESKNTSKEDKKAKK